VLLGTLAVRVGHGGEIRRETRRDAGHHVASSLNRSSARRIADARAHRMAPPAPPDGNLDAIALLSEYEGLTSAQSRWYDVCVDGASRVPNCPIRNSEGGRMIDGYYLSAYLYIGPLANLTNVFLRHDQNISLWHKSSDRLSLVHYWELERITGLKHHSRPFVDVKHAISFIDSLLQGYGLSMSNMVEVWGTPSLATVSDYTSSDQYLGLSYHSVAHLFSSLLVDSSAFYDETIVALAVDGAPDIVIDREITNPSSSKNWYAGCVVQRGKIEMFAVESPGLLWIEAARKYRMEEGSLMALASASTSKVKLTPPRMTYFNSSASSNARTVFNLINDQAISMASGQVASAQFSGFDPLFSYEENIVSIVMKVIQRMSIEIMERNIATILEKYKLIPTDTNLALAGGYALNCPSNSYIMETFGFKKLLAVPAVNDGGQSLGIALYAFHKKSQGQRLAFEFSSPYLGDADEHLQQLIGGKMYSPFIKSVIELDALRAVEDLRQHPIVWFEGRAEVGPRALGNRSILGDPMQEATKGILNAIKERQWWRPVAPVILEECVGEWFDNARPSPFMLETFRIKDSKIHLIPAIAHLDRTARVQTVNATQNVPLYGLIAAFSEATGTPLLCNTSLNDKGEPIINSVEEMFNFCLRKRIEVAYCNGLRIEFKNFEQFHANEPHPRQVASFTLDPDESSRIRQQLNPYGLDDRCLRIYLESPDLNGKYDLTSYDDVRVIEQLVKLGSPNRGE